MSDQVIADDGPAPSDPVLYAVIDRLVGGLATAERAPELARAREVYDLRRGHVREDEPLWEAWTQAFLEWFAIEWTDGEGEPALRRALRTEVKEEAKVALRSWLRSQRAVVEVERIVAGHVRVRDLIRGGLFEVDEQRALHGVGEGDIAEVRLVGFGDKIRFGRTFVFHPAGTRQAIEDHVERGLRERISPDEVIDQLAQLRLRTERYKHVDPLRIYRTTADAPIPD